MAVVNKNDLILLLLYAAGASGKKAEPVRGITRLMKLIFLLDKKIELDKDFNFEPYKMGPYSSEVYTAIEFFQSFPSPDRPIISAENGDVADDLINPETQKFLEDSFIEGDYEDKTNKLFKLTELGEKYGAKIWNGLDENSRSLVTSVKKEYASLPLKKLLRYVYDNYPDMTVNSTIKGDIYG